MRSCVCSDSLRLLHFPSLRCPSSCPSTSSSAMWWTKSLCTLAREDLGTLAEYDPLTLRVSVLFACSSVRYSGNDELRVCLLFLLFRSAPNEFFLRHESKQVAPEWMEAPFTTPPSCRATRLCWSFSPRSSWLR